MSRQLKELDSEVKRSNRSITGREVEMREGSTLVTRTDLSGKIVYANDDFVDISGYTREELIGQPHSMIRHTTMPRSAFRDLWVTIEAGRPWSGMVVNRCKNGDHYWVDANVAPIIEHGQCVGYMSVRRKPSRAMVASAEALYADVRESRKKFPMTPTRRGSLRRRVDVALAVAAVCGGRHHSCVVHWRSRVARLRLRRDGLDRRWLRALCRLHRNSTTLRCHRCRRRDLGR